MLQVHLAHLWGEGMNVSKFAAVLFLLGILVTASFGQSDRGTITGTVTDPSGAVVSNAKITATNGSTGAVRETTTSGEGNYTLPELPAAPAP